VGPSFSVSSFGHEKPLWSDYVDIKPLNLTHKKTRFKKRALILDVGGCPLCL